MPSIDINKKRGIGDAEISVETAWEDRYFIESINKLIIPVGFSLEGEEDNVFLDLAEEKHILAAGGMFSGIGMFRRVALLSLLIKNKPQFMRLVVIDPIHVLKDFYSSPSLQQPAATRKSDCENAIEWCLNETEKRYKMLLEKKSKLRPMVVIISELGELSQSKEDDLIRIMQMAKATGIHFIITTQRPGNNVITDRIKNNAPAKIAFQVPSKEESICILDESGAEKLIGQGDLLYRGAEHKYPLHLQGYSFPEAETGELVMKFT